LQQLLDQKQKYDPSVLLAKVKDSWMTDEEILLLIKKKEYEPAIEIYIKNGAHREAEDFCNSKPDLGLMSTLLKIYLDKFRFHWEQKTKLLQSKQSTESIKEKERALSFKKLALDLMKRYSSSNKLDPRIVLELIPEDWDIQSEDYNLVSYLSSMFDHLLTMDENTKISSHLSNMETLNKEKEVNEVKSSYLVIGDESMCKMCNRKLTYKFIKIYPNGGVYHSLCAKNDHECPVTKQRFDHEN
jgi:hypothetical protein